MGLDQYSQDRRSILEESYIKEKNILNENTHKSRVSREWNKETRGIINSLFYIENATLKHIHFRFVKCTCLVSLIFMIFADFDVSRE